MKTTDEAIWHILQNKSWYQHVNMTVSAASKWVWRFKHGKMGLKAKETLLQAMGYNKIDMWLEPGEAYNVASQAAGGQGGREAGHHCVVTADGNVLHDNLTLKQAQKLLAVHEMQDKADGTYTVGYYFID